MSRHSNIDPSFELRHGGGGGKAALADKGTLTYTIREYVIPGAVFIAMIWWLTKHIILPIVREPSIIPSYTGWGGGARNRIGNLEIVDADDPTDDDEPLAAEGGGDSSKTK